MLGLNNEHNYLIITTTTYNRVIKRFIVLRK